MKLAGLVGECSRFRTVKPFVKIGTWIEIESFPHGFAASIAQRSRHETIQGTTIPLATQATLTIYISLSQGKNLENNRVLIIILIVVRVGTCHSTLTERNSFFCVLVSFFLTVPYIVSPGLYLLRNSCISKRRLLKMQKISLLILCSGGHFLSFIHPLFPQ